MCRNPSTNISYWSLAAYLVHLHGRTCCSLVEVADSSPFFDTLVGHFFPWFWPSRPAYLWLLGLNHHHSSTRMFLYAWLTLMLYIEERAEALVVSIPLLWSRQKVHFPKRGQSRISSCRAECLLVAYIGAVKSMSKGAQEAAASFGWRKFSMPDPSCNCDQSLWILEILRNISKYKGPFGH